MFRQIIVIECESAVTLAALRGIAKKSQTNGNGNITVTGCGEKEWTRNGKRVAFRFAPYGDRDHRDAFMANCADSLKPGTYREVDRYDITRDDALDARENYELIFHPTTKTRLSIVPPEAEAEAPVLLRTVINPEQAARTT